MDAAAHMEAGHEANRRGDSVEARRCFLAAFELDGRAAAQISAANMALKFGDIEAAMQEYRSVLKRTDLKDTYRMAVEKKLSEQVNVAAAAARACCCGGVGAEPVRMVQAAAPEPEPRQQPPRCARECRHHECRQPGLAGVKPCVNVGASLYQSMSATN